MMVMPSGRRNSAPMPLPSARGAAPKMAAMVVIKIGRKRNRHACMTAYRGLACEVRSASSAKSTITSPVLLDYADEQNYRDEGNDVQVLVKEQEREHRPDARRREGRDNGEGVDQTLVQNPEDDIDGEQRGYDEQGLPGERLAKGQQGAGKEGVQGGGCAQPRLDAVDARRRLAQRDSRGEVEGNRYRGEQAGVIDR